VTVGEALFTGVLLVAWFRILNTRLGEGGCQGVRKRAWGRKKGKARKSRDMLRPSGVSSRVVYNSGPGQTRGKEPLEKIELRTNAVRFLRGNNVGGTSENEMEFPLADVNRGF